MAERVEQIVNSTVNDLLKTREQLTTELSGLVLTIDSRERLTQRIVSAVSLFWLHGGNIEVNKLDSCDYKIEGVFRDVSVNLGIEAKGLPQLCGELVSNHDELSEKLFKAFGYYDTVALFVEEKVYNVSFSDNQLDAFIKIPAVRDESANTCSIANYQNTLNSWANDGVLVRTLRSESLFGVTAYNVLRWIVKDEHAGLRLNTKNLIGDDFIIASTINLFKEIPFVGPKNAVKLQKGFGNMFHVCLAAQDHICGVLGPKTGSKVYKFLHANSGVPNHIQQGLQPSSDKDINKFAEVKAVDNLSLNEAILNCLVEPRTLAEIMEYVKPLGYTGEAVMKQLYSKNIKRTVVDGGAALFSKVDGDEDN